MHRFCKPRVHVLDLKLSSRIYYPDGRIDRRDFFDNMVSHGTKKENIYSCHRDPVLFICQFFTVKIASCESGWHIFIFRG